MPTSNPHERIARLEKAAKLYRLITSPRLRGTSTPAELLASITAWTETEWASASIITGTRPASAETRAVVLGMLRDDVEADPFERFGRAS